MNYDYARNDPAVLLAYKIYRLGEYLDESIPIKHTTAYADDYDFTKPAIGQIKISYTMSQPGIKIIKRERGAFAIWLPRSAEELTKYPSFCQAGKDPLKPESWETGSRAVNNSILGSEELIKEVQSIQRQINEKEGLRKNFYSWLEKSTISPEVMWIAAALPKRNDQTSLLRVCSQVSPNEPTEKSKELWQQICDYEKLPYTDLAYFSAYGDRELFESALELTAIQWREEKAKRISFAEKNGLRILERCQMIDANKEIIRPLMLEGKVSVRTMEEMGQNYFYGTDAVIERYTGKKAQAQVHDPNAWQGAARLRQDNYVAGF